MKTKSSRPRLFLFIVLMLMLMLLVLVSNGQAAGLGQTDGLNMFGTFAALGIVAV